MKNYYRKKNVLNEEVPIFDPKCNRHSRTKTLNS